MNTNDITYRFIIPETSDIPLSRFESGRIEDFIHLYCQGEFCWPLVTYLMLKASGTRVSLAYELDPSSVNFAHGNLLREMKPRPDCFCVSLQADFPHFPLAQCHVVQNRDQAAPKAFFIPLWPQINQRARDASREGVQTVAYQGESAFSDLDPDRLNADLKEHGARFEMLEPDRWTDLSEIDVLLGVRTFGRKLYKRKPPSKLINAWRAGVPFIGGWDSAFSQIGTPGEDYLRVSSHEELLDAIIRLKNDVELYEGLIAAGRERAREFTFETLAEKWEALLTTEIAENFSKWRVSPTKHLGFRVKRMAYGMGLGIRDAARKLYGIPVLKRLRDLYYDPVK